MRSVFARGVAVALLVSASAVTGWTLRWVLLGDGRYPGQLGEVLLVGAWPALAIPLAALGRPRDVLLLLLAYASVSALFGLGLGGPHFTLGLPAHLLAVAVGFRDASIVERPRWPGLVLATLGVGVGLLVVAMTYQCGATVVEESAPGEPAKTPTCVSRVHPVGLAIAGAGIVSFVALLVGWPVVSLVAGALLAVAGVPLVFSAGVFAWVAGFALLAAGSASWGAGPTLPRRVPSGRYKGF